MGQYFNAAGELRCRRCGQFTRDHAPTANRCRPCMNADSRARYAVPAVREAKLARSAFKAPIQSASFRGLKEAAVRAMGAACVMCGSTEALQIDHPNWDGAEHRAAESTTKMLKMIVHGGGRHARFEVRLLCEPCHKKETARVRQEMIDLWRAIRKAQGQEGVDRWL